ncbi:MAG TPA: twin-arginine translocase TatA/TatE family subunit [Solirubrobacteraceae bacterium]|jgi:sec-independent protein translocase protein TatA
MGLDNPLHIAFLLVILLLVFGAKRLPEMGRSLGEGLRGFKDSINHEGSESHHGGERSAAADALVTAAPATTTEDARVLAAAKTLSAKHSVASAEHQPELLRR